MFDSMYMGRLQNKDYCGMMITPHLETKDIVFDGLYRSPNKSDTKEFVKLIESIFEIDYAINKK